MSHNRKCFRPLIAGVVAASACYSSLASAAELVLEEIKVTAQLREESLQDVPISVNALSGEKLIDFGIDKIEDLQSYVPNLTMSETGIGTNIYIRGIGSGINQGFEQSTGLYVDGVSYGRAQLSRAPFLDLARVEVLRGPQNILFGKNSIAGAIRLITNKPGDTFEGSVSLLYEPEHGEQVADLILSGPLTSTLGARLAYRNRQMDGYIENLTTGDDEPDRDEETLRLTFVANPTEELELTLKLETAEFDVSGRQMEITDELAIGPLSYSSILASGGGGLFTPQGPSLLNNTQDYKRTSSGDTSDNSVDNITLSMDYALGDYTLTMIGAYMQYDYEEDCDCDFTGADIFRLLSTEEYEQSSLELRIASPIGNTIEYIAGFYYQDSDLEFEDSLSTQPTSILVSLVNPAFAGTTASRNYQQDSTMHALFGQLTWNISDDMRLNMGLRYSEEDKEASRALDLGTIYGLPVPSAQKVISPVTLGGLYAIAYGFEVHSISGDRTDEDVAPQISFEWDVTDQVMLYASATKGSKSGGFDVRSNADPRTSGTSMGVPVPPGAFEFEDESATSLEVGTKTVLLGGAAELNAALFFTKYDDLQISIFDGKVGFNVGNAAEADTYGLELDGRWILTESLTLYGSLAYIDFEFKDFDDAQCYSGEIPTNPVTGLCSRDGATNQYVADWSGNIGLDHRMPIGSSMELRTGADIIFTDDYNPSQSLDPRLDQSGYAKLNARIAIADIDNVWEVALVGKNLTDEAIMTYGAPTPLAYSVIGMPSYYTFWERPRSVALQGTYRF